VTFQSSCSRRICGAVSSAWLITVAMPSGVADCVASMRSTVTAARILAVLVTRGGISAMTLR
jgi:hypothetical protein